LSTQIKTDFGQQRAGIALIQICVTMSRYYINTALRNNDSILYKYSSA
jgi:hypothetical protein